MKMRHKSVILVCLVSFGVVSSFAIGTAVGVSWSKSEVVPVVLVKPGIAGFEPTEGSAIGNTWSKDQVKAVLLVKPGINGFEPIEGFDLVNRWRKDDVIAVSLTEPSINGFSPMQIGDAGGSVLESPHTSSGAPPVTDSVIESKIDGDFNGWDGETIIKLINGQIWRQLDYHYEYHYAFMPKVLIYKAGGIYKAKVDGTDTAVTVMRLK
jgi:hypothetical protein